MKISYGKMAVFLMLAALRPDAIAGSQQQLQVIAGAESHGMLDACECEIDPGGGVAKRASLLSSIGTPETRLLLDAGGFSAGGIYDDYSEGRSADSLRSARMISVMGMMRYDAVAIGDDDLQYGGTWLAAHAKQAALPLVCANCFTAGKKRLGAPFLVVDKAGMKIGITAVTTREKLFPVDPLVTVTEPGEALRLIWKEMVAKTDAQVILSHLGQEETATLLKKFPECDLAVNGHRKTGKIPIVKMGNVPCLQFGFQGKSLSGITFLRSGKQIVVDNARWYDITPELPDDPQITSLLRQKSDPPPVENVYDLYIMSQCPYGLEALNEFLAFAATDPSVRWNLWFIGSIDDDTVFSSLHGSGEVLDEKIWLAVRDAYPAGWTAFLQQRAAVSGPTMELAGKLGMDSVKINDRVVRSESAELSKHYFRSTRLSINSSPTLMVNNRPFSRNITFANLRRFQCLSRSSAGAHCDSLPECSEDADCRSPGKLGSCVKNKCEFRDAVPFEFTVLVADSTLEHPESKVIRTTTDLFAGADVQLITLRSGRGRQIVQKFAPAALPLYLFGGEVKLAYNFSTIKEGLVERDGVLTFRDGIVPVNYHLKRKKTPGTTVVYIDPFFTEIPELLSVFRVDSQLVQRVAVQPIIYQDPASTHSGTEERFRQEEALRWIALGAISKTAFRQYLDAYAKQPGGSYWPSLLGATGITPDSLTARVAAAADRLTAHWKTVESLDIRSPVLLLLDNVETVQVSGERELRRILNKRNR